jgi:hypothetical protein
MSIYGYIYIYIYRKTEEGLLYIEKQKKDLFIDLKDHDL